MAKAILYYEGQMIRQRGIAAPKRATIERWLHRLRNAFKKDLEDLGAPGVLNIWKHTATESEIRISCHGDVSFWIDRTADAMCTNT